MYVCMCVCICVCMYNNNCSNNNTNNNNDDDDDDDNTPLGNRVSEALSSASALVAFTSHERKYVYALINRQYPLQVARPTRSG